MILLRIGFILFFALLLIIILLLLNRRRIDTYLYKKDLQNRTLDQKEEIKRLKLLIEHEEEALTSSIDKTEQKHILKEIKQLKEDIKQIEER